MAIVYPAVGFTQIGDYKKYSDISSFYDFDIHQDIKYGVGKTNYQKLNESGSYDLITQVDLELDLFVPNTPVNQGKRAVVIMIPASGRGGCRDGVRYLENGSIDAANGCDKKTLLSGSRVTQEGINYNHINNSIASQYAKRGFIVASVNTRYNYQHTQFSQNGSNRWYLSEDGTDDGTNPPKLLNLVSAHLEYMVVDLKRVMRWLTVNANTYNIDPNYIFITGSSGAAKMAGLTAITNERQLIVDDPANINVAFETANNNWDARNSTPGIKGVILRKGDTNGTYNLRLMDNMSANTDSFMLWTGTADKSILHGMSEVIEEKCEVLGSCSSQLFSLANKTHSTASSATFLHPKSGNQNSTTHSYDFMVNAIHRDSENLPVINISQSNVSFNESVGNAQIRINRTGDASDAITFTVTADQMREVTRENASSGTFDLITRYVAKSSNSDGLVMYDESTGYAYEDAYGGNLRKSSDRVVRHTSGKGEGEYTEISSADNEYHNIDFTGKTQVLRMEAGQTSINFNVAIENDDLHEQNECFKVRILNAYGAKIGNSVETITIRDDENTNPSSDAVCSNSSFNENSENTPVINFANAIKNVTEGDSTNLTIFSDRTVSEDISIEYKTTQGDATTADFQWVNKVAVIPAGQNLITIPIQTREDTIVESNEKFSVDLLSITGGDADIGSVSTTVLTIIDDDIEPVISISPANKTVNEGNAVTFNVSSDLLLSEDIDFEYQTKTGSAGVNDFVWKKETKTIFAGTSSISISIDTVEDFLVEGIEKFTVDLNQIIDGSASIGSADSSQVSIIDDDSLPKITIGPSQQSLNEGSTAVLTIRSDRNVNENISIEYQTKQGEATIDDFNWVRRSVQIPAGQSSVEIEIDTFDDLIVEADEVFTVELREIKAGNAQIGSADSSSINIVDNDVISNISFSSNATSVSEGEDVILTIESDRTVSEGISIEYQTRVDSATSSDFEWQLRTAVIPIGETSVNIVVKTKEDQIAEQNESFTVTLNNVTGQALLSSPKTVRVTIIDDDAVSNIPELSIAPTARSVNEGSTVNITVSANKTVSTDIEFEYQTKVITATTNDFEWVKATAVIPAGSKVVNIPIRTIDDSAVEDNETFKVDINRIINGSAILKTTSSIITILDDDSISVIGISPLIRSVSEGNTISLTISTHNPVSKDVVVEYQTRVISATTQDFKWIRSEATIREGSRSVGISIATTEDNSVEDDEVFEVVLNEIVSGEAELGLSQTSVVTILDDETQPTIEFSRSTYVVEEGLSTQLTVIADRETQNNVTIEYQTRVATATTDDFVWEINAITIPKGGTSASIIVSTLSDEENDSGEYFTVRLNKVTSGWAALGSNKTTKVVIEDDLCQMFIIPTKTNKTITFCL